MTIECFLCHLEMSIPLYRGSSGVRDGVFTSSRFTSSEPQYRDSLELASGSARLVADLRSGVSLPPCGMNPTDYLQPSQRSPSQSA